MHLRVCLFFNNGQIFMKSKSTDCDAALPVKNCVDVTHSLMCLWCVKTALHLPMCVSPYIFAHDNISKNISPTLHNKHAVKYDTQKRRPMSGVSNGLWTIKLTGSSVLPITPCIPQDPQQDFSPPVTKEAKKAAVASCRPDGSGMMMTNSGALGLDSPCWPCCSRGTRSSRVTRVT